MANNLTSQVRNIAEVTPHAVCKLRPRQENHGRREWRGWRFWISRTRSKTMVDQSSMLSHGGWTRVAREVGTEGKLGGQAFVLKWGSGGTLEVSDRQRELLMAKRTLTMWQVRIVRPTLRAAVLNGESPKITVDVNGRSLD